MRVTKVGQLRKIIRGLSNNTAVVVQNENGEQSGIDLLFTAKAMYDRTRVYLTEQGEKEVAEEDKPTVKKLRKPVLVIGIK